MRINRREKALLSLGGILVFALFYYLFIVSPTISRQGVLEKYILKKEADLVKMVELNLKWDRFKNNKAKAEKVLTRRGKKFTLLSFLEGISRKLGIHNKIQYMKPLSSPEESGSLKQIGMEIKLDDINATQLVNFLYELEYSGKFLNIKRIKIQRFSKGKTQSLRVTLQVNTYSSS
jgi:hypothetical protein